MTKINFDVTDVNSVYNELTNLGVDYFKMEFTNGKKDCTMSVEYTDEENTEPVCISVTINHTKVTAK